MAENTIKLTNSIHRRLPTFIIQVIQTIINDFEPEKIILFGSYATRKQSKDSDLDLLVIMETTLAPAERQRMISRRLYPRKIPLDIIVKTPGEVRAAEKRVDPFMHAVLSEGMVVYARSG